MDEKSLEALPDDDARHGPNIAGIWEESPMDQNITLQDLQAQIKELENEMKSANMMQTMLRQALDKTNDPAERGRLLWNVRMIQQDKDDILSDISHLRDERDEAMAQQDAHHWAMMEEI